MKLPNNLFAALALLAFASFPVSAQTFTVSTADSASTGDYAGDGVCDEAEINQAINALPSAGGWVYLKEGTYDICASSAYAGVLIESSNVRLTGAGMATLLRLADDQNVNVIRVHGKNVENIEIESMRVDGNRAEQTDCGGDPMVPHDRFECSGIKAHQFYPSEHVTDTYNLDNSVKRVWLRNVYVTEAEGLNVMLSGKFVYVHDSYIGPARSDGVEILVGPGQIARSTYHVPSGATSGFGLGTDAADNVQIVDNLSIVDGNITGEVHRTWQSTSGHLVNDNLVHLGSGSTHSSQGTNNGGFAHFRAADVLASGNMFIDRSYPRADVKYGQGVLIGDMFLYRGQMVNENTGPRHRVLDSLYLPDSNLPSNTTGQILGQYGWQ